MSENKSANNSKTTAFGTGGPSNPTSSNPRERDGNEKSVKAVKATGIKDSIGLFEAKLKGLHDRWDNQPKTGDHHRDHHGGRGGHGSQGGRHADSRNVKINRKDMTGAHISHNFVPESTEPKAPVSYGFREASRTSGEQHHKRVSGRTSGDHKDYPAPLNSEATDDAKRSASTKNNAEDLEVVDVDNSADENNVGYSSTESKDSANPGLVSQDSVGTNKTRSSSNTDNFGDVMEPSSSGEETSHQGQYSKDTAKTYPLDASPSGSPLASPSDSKETVSGDQGRQRDSRDSGVRDRKSGKDKKPSIINELGLQMPSGNRKKLNAGYGPALNSAGDLSYCGAGDRAQKPMASVDVLRKRGGMGKTSSQASRAAAGLDGRKVGIRLSFNFVIVPRTMGNVRVWLS